MANKDIKFIIYQVLYIFVVCVVALKGANLDLAEVIAKDKVVDKEEADKTRKKLDSLLLAIMNLDTNVSKEDYDKMIQRIRDMKNQNVTMTINTQLQPKSQNTFTSNETKKEDEIKVKPIDKGINISGDIKVVQYSNTTLTNPNDMEMGVYADGNLITTISSHGSKTFAIANQITITIKCGDAKKTVQTLPKKAPVVSVIYIGGGSNLRSLQGTNGFKVKIAYEYSDPLDIKFSGNINVKDEGGNTYTISLKQLCLDKTEFEKKFEDHGDPPYRETFTVKVTDKMKNQTTSASGTFIFSEW